MKKKSMKFGIDIGHNSPPDTGARGIKFEDQLTSDLGNRIIIKLRDLNHQVIECKPQKSRSITDSLQTRCNIANANKVDLYVSIHFNAFNSLANGTEVFAISSTGRQFGQTVLDEITKLGFFRRGLKNGSHLYVLKKTIMPALLVECCFCDARKDMRIYDPEAMANAIVKGLTGKLPGENEPVIYIPDEEDNPNKNVLRLQRALNRMKFTGQDGKLLVEDGIIDTQTKIAVENFQKVTAIQQTGIVTNITWAAINQILSKRILRRNHAGGVAVRYVQYRLGADNDGIYGPQTEELVKGFQQQNSLAVDGIVGSITWTQLIG
ncbi:N-acetylmuramoyl-L-alanine amidase [Richelia intracellularis HH01]|jgi:N-acetylmuramoyl-L-alanine amidase|uniref:N-acetylmuramoyl-L-alanine amidase n=2 Tax=Richelia TaxID=98443 RepID=M1X5Y7_9NOST|nr:N-acetylmuramoyl-L-alanine amidase [Richelia intracellularis HH01]